jgi:hypothetical protein
MEIKHFKNNEMEGSVKALPMKLEVVVKFQIATRTKRTEGQAICLTKAVYRHVIKNITITREPGTRHTRTESF